MLAVEKLEYMRFLICLLYTSDAADDGYSVDLGGRRIIKKIFFKQKTAYEISEGLVGSEMCIRDREENANEMGRWQIESLPGRVFRWTSYTPIYA